MNRTRRRKLAKFARTQEGSAAILAAVDLQSSRQKTRRMVAVFALAMMAVIGMVLR